jgi:hypothetical protein
MCTQRAQHAKTHAREIAQRTTAIIYLIADAVPDASKIPQAMEQSIERFQVYAHPTVLSFAFSFHLPSRMLDEIRRKTEAITRAPLVSRVVHLRRNERIVADIKAQLDEAYRDLQVWLPSRSHNMYISR